MVDWHLGTLKESKQTASDIKSLFFEIESWPGHIAGQHCDFRITAENGYQAERAYSIVSAPGEKLIEFGVQILEHGEVSPYLWQMQPGDQIEIKGPLGGHFIWTPETPGTVVLIGGGSGICPLLSIYNAAQQKPVFIESAKSADKIMYYDQLKNKLITRLTSTEGHVDEKFLQDKLGNTEKAANVFICGPTPFVEAVATILVKMQFTNIKTERFGG